MRQVSLALGIFDSSDRGPETDDRQNPLATVAGHPSPVCCEE